MARRGRGEGLRGRSQLPLAARARRRPGPLEIASLKNAPSGRWRAKDILRATRLPLLRASESEEVAEKLEKIRANARLSPILIVILRPDVVAQIADGHHRTCAAYLAHEDTLVPGRILFV